jgi:lambda family phage portal protein
LEEKKALRRAAPQAKGYREAGASETRRALKGFIARSGPPNEDINWNNYTLRQRSRMLYMASPVATSAINTNRTKVVGTGLALKSSINRDMLSLSPEAARIWQRTTEAEFALWSSKKENVDATAVNNFEGLQQLAFKSWLMSGDSFALFKRCAATPTNPYTLRIHIVEADRVGTPTDGGRSVTFSPRFTDGMNPSNQNKIYDGVEVDKNGRIVAYYIRNTYPNQITAEETRWTRVEACGAKTGLPNILHIMDSERPDQYRGVPYLAQVIEPLLQLRRYTESELMAALVQSFFTAWIKTKTDPTDIPMNETGPGDVVGIPDDQPEDVSENDSEYEMGPGTVLHLEENEEVVFGQPNVPTAGFDSFVKAICRLVGAALELPYDVLVKEFGRSYSASRGALLEAWEAFKMRRKWFVDDFCQPVFEVWLSEAVARGRIKAPGFFDDPRVRAAWCGARWIGPVQGQLDPTKESRANEIHVAHGWKTNEQVAREMGGGDWEDNADQLKIENKRLTDAKSSIAAASPDKPGENAADEEEDEGASDEFL